MSENGREIGYRGDQLVGTPAVVAALGRAPQVLLPIVDADDEESSLDRVRLCAFLHLGSADGLCWELSLDDEVKAIVDTGPDLVDDDLLAEALAAQPDVVAVDHIDREIFDVRLSRLLRADEMFARWLDAIVAAHRELARRRGIELPY